MKQMLMMIAAVVLVGCGKDEKEPPKAVPEKLIADPIIEKAIRGDLKKYTGALTEADLTNVTTLVLSACKTTDVNLKELGKLKKVSRLFLEHTKITDEGLKELAKLQKLEELNLHGSKVTKAGVAELKKELPKCKTPRW